LIVGLAATFVISSALYRSAERQWVARAESEAQRLSAVLLGWMDDSYAPLSGLAALIESSHGTQPEAFLNAFDGMESRARSVLLGAVAMLRQDARGRWRLAISSGNFELLDEEATSGFTRLRPLIEFALARPNQFVLGPPIRGRDGAAVSAVMIALSNVERPTMLVGKVEYATLETALLGTPVPPGFSLTLKAKFMEAPQTWPIVRAEPDQKVVEQLVTRAATGSADLEIIWGVTRAYANGPDLGMAAATLAGGITATLLVALLVASLVERNRMINAKVDRATAALRVSGEEQAAILESATLGIAFIKDRVIMRANSRLDELFGFDRGEQIGRPTRMWYPDEESYAAVGEVYEQLRRGETHHRELLLKRKSGELFWCRLSGRAVEVGDLSRGTVWMLEDITERRRAEEAIEEARQKAEEATEMKSMFLANMSHEIRTPMNAIIGLSDLALKTPLDPKQRDYISKVHRAGTSLLAVVIDILDFSKIEAGRLELETLDFSMDDVVGAVATVTAQKAHEKGLEFLTRVSPAVPARLRGDPLRLGQILTNLVDNAVKFTEHGQVQLTVEMLEQNSEKAQIQCSVRDTGIGVTREQAARLFQPFIQANMSTTRTHGGTGLGLSIARRLVEAMSGEIRLDSQPGVGSTFSFTVWLGVGAPTDSPGAVVPAAVRAGRLRGARILVTEDNEINQQIAVELLEGAGGKVEIASNGREAIEAMLNAAPPYDLVLMDLQMPEVDGYQATERIRSDAHFADLPIIAMTAHATLEERERCLDAGMNDHVSKPIDPEALFETLGRYYVPSETRSVGDAPTEPPPSAPTEEHPSEEARLPSVEGLDAFGGLRRVAGNRTLYLTLLRKFIDEQSNLPARIAACLTTGDYDGAERLAHTLKGLAGNLGAGAVGAASAALEASIASHGDASRIERLRGRLADMLTRLHDSLDRALAPRPTAAAGAGAPADPEFIKTLVAWMRTQLRELDPGAVDLLESHRDVFASIFSRTALTAFERHVQTYAFDAADAMLTQAIEAAAPDVRVSS